MARVNRSKAIRPSQHGGPGRSGPARPKSLRLPEVTLVCVQPRVPALGVATLQHCMRDIDFAQVLLFTDPNALKQAPEGIELKGLRLESSTAHAEFMLRGLVHYLQTSHVLIVQWNGFVLDAKQWDPAFQLYDHVCASVEPGTSTQAARQISFSLQSRRLLQAMQDPAMVIRAPENHCLLHLNRQRLEQVHDVRFAPVDLARRFSFDQMRPDGATLGFEGLHNLPRVLRPDALRRLVRSLPDELVAGQAGQMLCAGLISQGELVIAQMIIERRRRLGLQVWSTLQLRARMALAGMMRSGRKRA